MLMRLQQLVAISQMCKLAQIRENQEGLCNVLCVLSENSEIGLKPIVTYLFCVH